MLYIARYSQLEDTMTRCSTNPYLPYLTLQPNIKQKMSLSRQQHISITDGNNGTFSDCQSWARELRQKCLLYTKMKAN